MNKEFRRQTPESVNGTPVITKTVDQGKIPIIPWWWCQ